MASLEFIQKRFEGKQKEIAKLEKKLERIKKAESTGWKVNPYYYNEDDLRWTTKDLEKAKADLVTLTEKLAQETEKAQSRNVKAILDFLDMWKQRCKNYYVESFKAYTVAAERYAEEEHAYNEWWFNNRSKATNEEKREREANWYDYRKAYTSRWAFLVPYVTRVLDREAMHYVKALDTEKVDKDLEQEAKEIYDDIIERTNKITGKITDASGLSVGEKGELNGYIFGERGTAKVQTIGAGGYNIQRFHFRTLIHSI